MYGDQRSYEECRRTHERSEAILKETENVVKAVSGSTEDNNCHDMKIRRGYFSLGEVSASGILLKVKV